MAMRSSGTLDCLVVESVALRRVYLTWLLPQHGLHVRGRQRCL
jgi:hypothetical protein